MNVDVLIISNNSYSRITYAAGLTGYGYEVAETPSFQEARSWLDASVSPRSIVIDLKLTATPAGAFIDYIRHTIGRDDIRIIVIGGNEAEAKTVGSVGADMFLYRPVDMSQLVQHVS